MGRNIIFFYSTLIILWTVLHFVDNESEIPSFVTFLKVYYKLGIQELLAEPNNNFVAGSCQLQHWKGA